MSPSKTSVQKAVKAVAVNGDGTDPGQGSDEVAAALQQLQADKRTPGFIKVLMNHVVSYQKELSAVLSKNQELQEQLAALREENSALKAALVEAAGKSGAPAPHEGIPVSILSYVDEREHLRSIVVAGVAESTDTKSTERAIHDSNFVKDIFNHLEVECIPQITYRLGKPQEGRPRQSLVLRRASRLRSFSCRGVYIRPSLTKQERERNREARLARRNSHDVAYLTSQGSQLNRSAVN